MRRAGRVVFHFLCSRKNKNKQEEKTVFNIKRSPEIIIELNRFILFRFSTAIHKKQVQKVIKNKAEICK